MKPVRFLEGEMDDYCHPSHAQRTKCACGRVLTLSGAVRDTFARCVCGRAHRKISESAFALGTLVINGRISTGKRRGGKTGCPGIERLFRPPKT